MDGRTHGRRQNYIPPTSSGDNNYGKYSAAIGFFSLMTHILLYTVNDFRFYRFRFYLPTHSEMMDISTTYKDFFKDVLSSHCRNISVSHKLLIVGLIVEKVFVVLFLENGRYHFTNVQ